MRRAGALFAAGVATLTACSSSSTPTSSRDAGAPEASVALDAKADHAEGGCASTLPCSGMLSGGVNATLADCTISGEEGLAVGFGEVTFNFTGKDGGGASMISGGGNVSTLGKFDVSDYHVDAGLWNDTGTTGTAADSLWSVAWSASGAAEMAQCNGIPSPDETPSICQAATLDVTSVDTCHHIHGTLRLTIPAYQAAPEVDVSLAF